MLGRNEIVEEELCERCEVETSRGTCIICGRQVCDQCSYTVEMKDVDSDPLDPGVYSTETYCYECAEEINLFSNEEF